MRMDPSVSGELDESRHQFNLGTMLFIAFAAVVGTTLTVWGLHFMHLSTSPVAGSKPFPRIAVLPFHSLSSRPEDIRYDGQLTNALIGGLARISRVEALPSNVDADPVVVGRELGVRMMLIGRVERLGARVRVRVQMVSARDGSQVWAGSFDGDSNDLGRLSAQIDGAVAPHLTALLD
jgi:TolB-like protein